MKRTRSPKLLSGLASLPAILAMAFLVLVVALGMTALAFTENLNIAAASRASQARIYAEAGARDALLRIARNKLYSCPSVDCYPIEMVTSGCDADLNGCAKVSVSAGLGTSADPKIITSRGLVKNNVRTIRVDVVLDLSLNGEIATTTWREL